MNRVSISRPGCAGERQKRGIAHPQWPVSGRAKLGQLALDVDVDGAEEVDVLAMRR